jgi:3D-(3,5/4)-trihydroxycyclohexane-1,2-dione acylhydrolase (decyclizing)
MSKIRLTAAQALVRFLGSQYSLADGRRTRLVPRMLGIFGHGNVAGIGQALDEYRNFLPYMQGRNEQGLVHIAAAYSKQSRRRSLLAVTSSIGPGATNMVTGAALATINRLPVLLVPGDYYATRRQGPVLQQLEHPSYADWSVNDCFRPVSRFFDRITRPEQLLTALPEAMRVLTSPSEVGAAVLAFPQDVQSQAYDFPERFFEEREWPIRRPLPEEEDLTRVASLFLQAKKPVLIAGGGVIYSEAEAVLAGFAEEFGIPVVETFGGKGSVQQDAWWGMGGLGLEGNPAANRLVREADLVLAVGTRLTDFATASQSIFSNPAVRFASINVSGRDAAKQGAAAIVSDARTGLEGLRDACRKAGVRANPDWERRARQLKEDWLKLREEALFKGDGDAVTQGRLIGLLQAQARPGDVIITAAGGPPGDLLKVWDATGGRYCHLEFGYSCMGYEVPAAIGVRLAKPDGEVISFVGDGSFLMQPSELVTAVQEGLKVTIVVSDNHGFQVIRRLQLARVGRHFGNEFRYRSGDELGGDYLPLDLAKVAEGLGSQAIRASGAEAVRDALEKARASTGPVVVVVPTVPGADLPSSETWWDVAPAEVSGQEWVTERRREYEEGLREQRWHG